MSDVAAGGATVFTEVGAAVRPMKVSSLFHYSGGHGHTLKARYIFNEQLLLVSSLN